MVLAWAGVVAAFSLRLPFYLTTTNAATVLNFSVVTFVVAAGFTIVLIGGGLDLSVGSTLMVSGVTVAALFQAGVPLPLAWIVGFVTGPVIGLGNGLAITRLRINPLIATLSTLYLLRAFGYSLTGSKSIQVRDPGFRFARGVVFGLPVAVYFLIVVAALTWGFLRWTKAGRHIRAIGGNPGAARQAALNVDRYRLSMYVLGGAYSGLGGILLASIAGVGDPTAGTGQEFVVATAVLLGGASLSGGRGSIVGTLVGVLFITSVANALVQFGAIPEAQLIINGVLLIAAVAVDQRPRGGYR